MIISASRRTDIPSYYAEWFFGRLKEKYVLVRNPFNPHQVSKVSLSPEVVDGIVFWTKNPAPMINRLMELENYHYYFQFTVTPYGAEIEKNLPSKNEVIIPSFQRLSQEIGKDKVVWRYDPIFFNEVYTLDCHCRCFKVLAAKLARYTEQCTVSFLDLYKNTRRNARQQEMRQVTAQEQLELLGRFAEIAKPYHIRIDTCAEVGDFSGLGIMPAHCIDKERLERIGQFRLDMGKDKNQRNACGCVESIDIGSYNTCKNGCVYCYANYNSGKVGDNFRSHNPLSPLLFGEITESDYVREREVKSFADGQMSLFEL